MTETKESGAGIDERISSFLSSQTTLTLAVSTNNSPYCANCFYAFVKDENLLVFKSKPETTHVQVAFKNPYVAGTVTPDVLEKTRVQGIQFTGKIISSDKNIFNKAKNAYYSKFPFALAFSGEIFIIELFTLKYTDNKLGFGKRLEWKK